jgi:mannose-6-phosphate isomerase-like protein (cupin superfamily)
MIITEMNYGRAEELVRTEEYVLKRHLVDPGLRSDLGYHLLKDQTYFVVRGQAVIEVSGDVKVYPEGYSVRIRPRQSHRIGSVLGCILEEVSTAADDLAYVWLEPGGDMPPGWAPDLRAE